MGRRKGSKNKTSKMVKVKCKFCTKEKIVYPYIAKIFMYCSYYCKGKDYVMSEEGRQKLSESMKYRRRNNLVPQPTFEDRSKAMKGNKPWNKGLNSITDPRVSGGKNHYKWKKNRDDLVTSDKKHLDVRYKIWMKEVKNRDNWKCRIKNENCKGRLEAHHILNWVDYTEIRYDINNGITLCHAHHPRGRAEEKRLIPTFMELVSVSKD